MAKITVWSKQHENVWKVLQTLPCDSPHLALKALPIQL